MLYFVYILKSEKTGKYYIGQTADVIARIKRHNAGRERYTSKEVPWRLVFFAEVSSRSEAMSMERKIKNLKSHQRIEAFISEELMAGRGCREL